MWIFFSNAMISAVEHRDDPRLLMVRARLKGDLKRVFGKSFKVTETPKGDYRFRTIVSRPMLKFAIAREVDRIAYDNFKDSVEDDARHTAYMGVWGAMHRAQSAEQFPQPKLLFPKLGSLPPSSLTFWERLRGLAAKDDVFDGSFYPATGVAVGPDEAPVETREWLYGIDPDDVMAEKGFALARPDRVCGVPYYAPCDNPNHDHEGRFCAHCDADLIGNDPHALDCPVTLADA